MTYSPDVGKDHLKNVSDCGISDFLEINEVSH